MQTRLLFLPPFREFPTGTKKMRAANFPGSRKTLPDTHGAQNCVQGKGGGRGKRGRIFHVRKKRPFSFSLFIPHGDQHLMHQKCAEGRNTERQFPARSSRFSRRPCGQQLCDPFFLSRLGKSMTNGPSSSISLTFSSPLKLVLTCCWETTQKTLLSYQC